MTTDCVERKVILDRIDGIWDCNDMTFTPNDHCCNVPEDCKGCKWVETKNAIRRLVENAPAADVHPVMKGTAVPVYDSHVDYDDAHLSKDIIAWACPFCGSDRVAKFCADCGADLRRSDEK